jgi:hypothetical protein
LGVKFQTDPLPAIAIYRFLSLQGSKGSTWGTTATIAAAPGRPASGNQSERIRKLISRWHRDELGAERKAARRKCLKALTPILDIIRK